MSECPWHFQTRMLNPFPRQNYTDMLPKWISNEKIHVYCSLGLAGSLVKLLLFSCHYVSVLSIRWIWGGPWVFSYKRKLAVYSEGLKTKILVIYKVFWLKHMHKDLHFSFLWRFVFVCNQFLSEFQKCKDTLLWRRWQLTKLLSLTFWGKFSN